MEELRTEAEEKQGWENSDRQTTEEFSISHSLLDQNHGLFIYFYWNTEWCFCWLLCVCCTSGVQQRWSVDRDRHRI